MGLFGDVGTASDEDHDFEAELNQLLQGGSKTSTTKRSTKRKST